MNEPIKMTPKGDACRFCGKTATLLCDMNVGKVISHARGAGFGSHIITCDKKICPECTTRINGFDYCPDCIIKIKVAQKGVSNE